nr:immunoglobulin light chain junction region [Macaca mulatta]MOW42489.1 immunoglobulin light chain junction region [Macaca mulatta]MPN90809.1 immunoglobulin light chain junction region [Macaca mulatta]MPN90828.1 immunoglobulin light chain junction region [Macaca mulatta]MPN90931.1 immunoglobulin light chain junction region [Macaca mulatta]
CQHGYGTPPTF